MAVDPIPFYKEKLHLQGATFSQIEHEEAMVAIVYRVALQDGHILILKRNRKIHHHVREVYFLEHLAGKAPVPRILQVVEPEDGMDGAILMECLPGGLLSGGELTDSLAYEIGHALALIHLNQMPGYGDPATGELSPDPRPHFTLKLEEGLAECQGHLPSQVMDRAHHYYESQFHQLTSVDGPCMVHRDYRPGNLMVDRGKLQGVLDWAGARASFAEEDFVTLEDGEWLRNPTRKASLLAGYASCRAVPHYHHLIPFLRFSKAIATLGFIHREKIETNSSARLYQRNLKNLITLLKDV